MSVAARKGALPAAEAPTRAIGPRPVKTHAQVLRGNAGAVVDALSFVQASLANAELEHQTLMIARKLEVAGWDPRRLDAGGVVSIGLVTGAVQRDSGWRNTNVLPAVAKRNRASMLAVFGLWLEETPGAQSYCRYAVVSSGVRCLLSELPERLKWFNDRLGRFVERAKGPRWDVRVQLVTVEATFKREDDGEVSVNLHANLIYWPQRVLGSEKWGDFLRWMRMHFKTQQVEDTGVLAKPAELIKYAMKPSEIMQLTSDETRFLAETLHRRQLVRTYDNLGSFCRGLKERHEKVRFDREEGAWCRMLMRTKEEAEQTAMEREMREVSAEMDGVRPKEGPAPRIENQLLYQTLPQARASCVAESFVGVRNYTPTPTTDPGKENLRILEERRAAFVAILSAKGVPDEALEVAASRLDTCTKIPHEAALSFGRLEAKPAARVLRQIGIPLELAPRYAGGAHPAELAEMIWMKLERNIPKERHEWRVTVQDLTKAAREAAADRKAKQATLDSARAMFPDLDVVSAREVDPPPVRSGGIRERALDASARRLFAVGGTLVDGDGVIAGNAPRTHSPSADAVARDALGLRFGARGTGEAITKALDRARAEADRRGVPFVAPSMTDVMRVYAEAH